MPELILEIDKDDNSIGMRSREDFYTDKLYHRSSVLLLFNNEGELLLQKRSVSKKWFPGVYEFSVSGTTGDESDKECIEREAKEELGLTDLKFKFLFKITPSEKNDRVFNAVFSAQTNKEIVYDPEEIDSVQWVSLERLQKRITENSNRFSPQLIIGLEKYLKKNN